MGCFFSVYLWTYTTSWYMHEAQRRLLCICVLFSLWWSQITSHTRVPQSEQRLEFSMYLPISDGKQYLKKNCKYSFNGNWKFSKDMNFTTLQPGAIRPGGQTPVIPPESHLTINQSIVGELPLCHIRWTGAAGRDGVCLCGITVKY